MVATILPLDFWTVFVEYVFGNFWLAVIGIAGLIFAIMAFLGRVSIYSVSLYLLMFFMAMALGYGYNLLSILITLIVVFMFISSVKSYIDSVR